MEKKLSFVPRDPVSLVIALVFIFIIVMMQLCIEIKKHFAEKKEKENVQMAIVAKKTLATARHQVKCETNFEPASPLIQVIFDDVMCYLKDPRVICWLLAMSIGSCNNLSFVLLW